MAPLPNRRSVSRTDRPPCRELADLGRRPRPEPGRAPARFPRPAGLGAPASGLVGRKEVAPWGGPSGPVRTATLEQATAGRGCQAAAAAAQRSGEDDPVGAAAATLLDELGAYWTGEIAGLGDGANALAGALVVLAGSTGSLLGAVFWYVLGRRLGGDRLKRLAARHGRWLTLSPGEIDRAEAWFRRHGARARG